MQKRIKTALVGAAFLFTLSSTAHASESVDWTPLLKEWENGCQNSEEWSTFTSNLIVFHDNKPNIPAIGTIILPEKYANDLGEIHIEERTDSYTIFEIPVKNGTYYGIPIKIISYFTGHQNGLNGSAITFKASHEEAASRLSDVNYIGREEESGFYKAELMKNRHTEHAELLCDRSV